MNESPRPEVVLDDPPDDITCDLVAVPVMSHAEQTAKGITFPRANCRACTVSYGLNRDDTMRRHGPYGHPPCTGSNRPPLGMPDLET